jgi:hypothetical protein
MGCTIGDGRNSYAGRKNVVEGMNVAERRLPEELQITLMGGAGIPGSEAARRTSTSQKREFVNICAGRNIGFVLYRKTRDQAEAFPGIVASTPPPLSRKQTQLPGAICARSLT